MSIFIMTLFPKTFLLIEPFGTQNVLTESTPAITKRMYVQNYGFLWNAVWESLLYYHAWFSRT